MGRGTCEQSLPPLQATYSLKESGTGQTWTLVPKLGREAGALCTGSLRRRKRHGLEGAQRVSKPGRGGGTSGIRSWLDWPYPCGTDGAGQGRATTQRLPPQTPPTAQTGLAHLFPEPIAIPASPAPSSQETRSF